MPLLSVVLPTYNRASWLPLAIRSVEAQTYPRIELVVVDDGSTDDTPVVLDQLGRRIPGLVRLRKENGGCASARNHGLRAARGALLALLDSDDEWEPGAAQALVATLMRAGADIVYSPSIEVRQDRPPKVSYPPAASRPERLAIEHFLATNVRPGSFVFTRRAYERVGHFDESLLFNEDSDYFQRLALACSAAYSPIPTLRHHHHTENKSNNRVQLYRALLRSSQNILANHPEFADRLGSHGPRRLRQIESWLVEALLRTDQMEEASKIGRKIFADLRLNVKLAILLKNRSMLDQEARVREYLSGLKSSFLRRAWRNSHNISGSQHSR